MSSTHSQPAEGFPEASDKGTMSYSPTVREYESPTTYPPTAKLELMEPKSGSLLDIGCC